MPWTSQPPGHAFTDGTPWLPFGEQAATRPVGAQQADPDSTLALYRRALALRTGLRTQLSRRVRWLDVPPQCMAFARAGQEGEWVCVLNAGEQPVGLPLDGELLLSSRSGATLRDGTLQLPSRSAAWVRR